MWRFNLALQSMSSATAAINAGEYVLLNCGASVPAQSATKWPSHPRAVRA
jgi:hypothetical protein